MLDAAVAAELNVVIVVDVYVQFHNYSHDEAVAFFAVALGCRCCAVEVEGVFLAVAWPLLAGVGDVVVDDVLADAAAATSGLTRGTGLRLGAF